VSAFSLCFAPIIDFLECFADRCTLQHADGIEQSQLVLVEALETLFLQNHPGQQFMFPKIIALITNLRTLARLYKDQEEKIGTEWSTELKFPPLFYEIFTH
jgi:hypothetical protein